MQAPHCNRLERSRRAHCPAQPLIPSEQFQRAGLIPVQAAYRAENAYKALEQAAGGDFITDVQVQETWTYAFVGTVHCTVFQAKAIRAKAS